MLSAISVSDSPTRTAPRMVFESERTGPIQYSVVPPGSASGRTYLSPWASIWPLRTARTAPTLSSGGSLCVAPGGISVSTSLPVAFRTRMVSCAGAAFAWIGRRRLVRVTVSPLARANATPCVSLAARNWARRSASSTARWSLLNRLARRRPPSKAETVAVVAREVMRAVPTIPTKASRTKNGRTIFCWMLQRGRRSRSTVVTMVSQFRYGPAFYSPVSSRPIRSRDLSTRLRARGSVAGGSGGVLDPEDLDHELAVPWPIELQKEDALPLAQIQVAVRQRDALAAGEQQMLAVGMPVGALVGVHVDGPDREVVVPVGRVRRAQAFQHGGHVGQQQRLVLVDHDRGGGVLGEEAHPPLGDPGPIDHVGHPVGDVHEIPWRAAPNGEGLRPDGEAAHPPDPGSAVVAGHPKWHRQRLDHYSLRSRISPAPQRAWLRLDRCCRAWLSFRV